MLERGAEAALIDDHGSTTWAELNERVNRLIHMFVGQGLRSGDRIAQLSSNCREAFEVLLAAAHSGVSLVPLNAHSTADEVRYVVEDSEARLLITDSELASRASSIPRPQLTFGPGGSYERALLACPDEEPTESPMGSIMFYTSGTTGRPKGVRRPNLEDPSLTADIYLLMAAGMIGPTGFPAEGRTLLCGPYYHSAQWAFSFLPLISGFPLYIQRKFEPSEALRLIDEYDITNLHAVPTQFVRFLQADESTRRAFRGESLELVVHGAAPCAPGVKRAMIDWWGPIITEYYGATEGGFITVITAEEWLRKPGSVGKPVPNTDLAIVADDDVASHEDPYEHGLIYTRNSITGAFAYHGDEEKTANAHGADGMSTLGDVGYIDEDGYLFLSDRKIDMVISGGVNIYPTEVEGVLIEHPDVADVAVFGIPNDEFGEELKAAVALTPGVTWSPEVEGSIIELARTRLARFKVPRSFDIHDELPRNPAGKLLKHQLRSPYWEAAGRTI